MKSLIVIEETATGFSAYSPPLPGCASICETAEETERTRARLSSFHPGIGRRRR